MKVHGPMYSQEKPTDAHREQRRKQNGKKSRALRYAALKGQMKRKARRLAASNG